MELNNTSDTKYQHYTSSRVSMRMISHSGRKITFVNYEYLTCEKDIIEYLDDEIAKGLRVIAKGKLLTRKEADPMEALKAKHIAEYLEKEAQELKDAALGISKDMGTSKSKEAIAAGPKPVSSKGVTNSDKL